MGMKTVSEGDGDGGGSGGDEGGDDGSVIPSMSEWPSPEVCPVPGWGGASSVYTLHTIFHDLLWLCP